MKIFFSEMNKLWRNKFQKFQGRIFSFKMLTGQNKNLSLFLKKVIYSGKDTVGSYTEKKCFKLTSLVIHR